MLTVMLVRTAKMVFIQFQTNAMHITNALMESNSKPNTVQMVYYLIPIMAFVIGRITLTVEIPSTHVENVTENALQLEDDIGNVENNVMENQRQLKNREPNLRKTARMACIEFQVNL